MMEEGNSNEEKMVVVDADTLVAPHQELDADKLVRYSEVRPPYPERRDGWITITALLVIGGSAVVSSVALLVFPYLFSACDAQGHCTASEAPVWAAELIKLSLVSSLAFVMGTKQA